MAPTPNPDAAAPGHAIRFVKAEANGNDFLIVDAAAVPPAERPRFARLACERHSGLGADGIEFVSPNPTDGGGGYDLVLHNADGGEAELSGNGSRCVVACYARHGLRQAMLHTRAGVLAASVLGEINDAWSIEIEIGVPQAIASAVLRVGPADLTVWTLSMGNPQCCLLVDRFAADWERIGAAIESHPHFPQRTNVAFVRVLDRGLIEARIFERGVGPTLSSGTGSCAAAVAAISARQVDSPLAVITPGGTQTVAWAGGTAPVRLLGPARVVAEGTYLFPAAAPVRS